MIGLTHLCEFIEDCEFSYLSIKILHLLGREGPNTLYPSRYIRYIYNRICLEKANVRAAAVSALAKFAFKLPALRPSIIVLLRRFILFSRGISDIDILFLKHRSCNDSDDEVRDRAIFYLRCLENLDSETECEKLLTDGNASFVLKLLNSIVFKRFQNSSGKS